jgi:hemerythrin
MEGRWSQDLSIGIELLDSQHKELFQHISTLRAALRAGTSRDTLFKTLSFLEEYVVVHFDAEVQYMRRFDYPGINEHETEHQKFIKALADFKKELQTLESRGEITSFLGIEIERKLSGWLADHIGNIDKKMGAFLAERL